MSRRARAFSEWAIQTGLVGTAFAGAKGCYQPEGVLRQATALVLIAEVSRKREHLNT